MGKRLMSASDEFSAFPSSEDLSKQLHNFYYCLEREKSLQESKVLKEKC